MTHEVQKPIKLAIFVHSTLDDYTKIESEKDHDPNYSSFTRISEWTEVTFPPRIPDQVTSDRVKNIEREIEDTYSKAMNEIQKLQTKKDELLAISYSPSVGNEP